MNTIIAYFNPDKKTIVETDILDYINGKVLSQYNNKRILRKIACFSIKHILAQYNYEIYDKELIALIRVFRY